MNHNKNLHETTSSLHAQLLYIVGESQRTVNRAWWPLYTAKLSRCVICLLVYLQILVQNILSPTADLGDSQSSTREKSEIPFKQCSGGYKVEAGRPKLDGYRRQIQKPEPIYAH